jgi:hypothetical protein
MLGKSTRKPDQKISARLLLRFWLFWRCCGVMMLIGYMRVSKSDSSQVLHLQRDALLIATEGEPVAPLASPCP